MVREAWDRIARLGLVATVLLTVSLAGCIGGSGTSTPSDAPADGDVGDDREAIENQTKNSTVKTDEDVEFDPDSEVHAHDLWDGRSEIELVQTTIPVDWSEIAAECATGLRCDQAPTFLVDVPIDPDDPVYVYPGTGKLTVTLDWSSTGVEDSAEPLRPIACVTNHAFVPNCEPETQNTNATHVFGSPGSSWTIDDEAVVNLQTADPPHTLKSNWRFAIRPCSQSADGRCFPQVAPNAGVTEFDLTVTIHRGDQTLPVDPPHFAFFGEEDELAVLDGYEVSSGKHQSTAAKWSSSTVGDGNSPIWRITGPQVALAAQLGQSEQRVVPVRTDRITVELRWSSDTAADLQLGYRTAEDGWQAPWRMPDATGSCGSGCIQYDVAVSRDQADSPYALQTQWEFGIFEAADDPVPMTNYEVTMDVTAQRGEV